MNSVNASAPSPNSSLSPGVNPRRVAANNSKSLPGSKKPATVAKQELSSVSPLFAQESSGSSASASRWFDSANQNVCQGQNDEANSNEEPPFYIANQANASQTNIRSDTDEAFGKLTKDDSENDDLRGVIDDLTVENKRLRQILKANARRTTSPSTENGDKLFEVKMHGLPPEKKRELEILLKTFATNVNTNTTSHVGHELLRRRSEISSTSGARLPTKMLQTDSGYGSMSNSGHTSATHTRGGPTLQVPSRKQNERNVETYLRDIPDSLLPRQSLPLSERAKMAIVVRRLEQLFTGKTAVPGEHRQPLQQQEVSHAAARADSLEDVRISKKRKSEGKREARVLPYDSRINLDTLDHEAASHGAKRSKLSSEGSDASVSNDAASTSRLGSPDQRPTRPLDLDIERAQVATDNIDYIRHLGLSSPHPYKETGQSDEPWLYVNLLTNMAQLHTLNVTPEFIRRAVKKLSTKFDLSKDGHKVRWKGGDEGTTFTKEEEKAIEATNNTNTSAEMEISDDAGLGSSKRSKTASESNGVTSLTPSEDKTNRDSNRTSNKLTSNTSQHKPSTAFTSVLPTSTYTAQTKSVSAFDYKPIRYHKGRVARHDSYLNDSSSSYESNSGDSSGLVVALSQSNLNQPKSEEGTLTFYSNPYYYSDFSGDKSSDNYALDKAAIMGETVGIKYEEQGESALRYHDACYFTPQFAPKPHSPSASDPIVNFHTSTVQQAGEDETQPIELPVCGLGGVMPEDNFFVDVKVLRAKLGQSTMTRRHRPLKGTRCTARYQYRVAKQEKMSLRPSALPPPSYCVLFTSSSSGLSAGTLDDSDSSSSSSSDNDDDAHPPPQSMLRQLSTSASTSTDSNDVDMNDNISVDMLATARAIDPARIAEEERQYMINQPSGGRVVAGSLAATVGASWSGSSEANVGPRSDVEEVGSEEDSERSDDSNEDEDMEDE